MNPSGVAILTNPDPCGHIVYPYTDAAHVAEAVSLFAGVGLRRGESAVLIMTPEHCGPVRQRLKTDGFDVPALESAGQIVCEDAEEVLSTFTFDGIIDEDRFKRIVGGMIEAAKRAGNGHVRLFGEMVDLIWQTNLRATERLEQLWNEVVETHAVPLLCAYSLAGTKPDGFPASLVSCHSHAVS